MASALSFGRARFRLGADYRIIMSEYRAKQLRDNCHWKFGLYDNGARRQRWSQPIFAAGTRRFIETS
ncbi:MAG: hypothetical protein P4L98_11140 [Ancalomicrobiaceae bacterium]|nr:hypothetical protein [Ancalomicrobiaceae bacterium]